MTILEIVNDVRFANLRAETATESLPNRYEVGRWHSPMFQTPALHPQTGAAATPRRGHRSGYVTCSYGTIIVRGPALETVGTILSPWVLVLPTNDPESWLFETSSSLAAKKRSEVYSNQGTYVCGKTADALKTADYTEGILLKEVTA